MKHHLFSKVLLAICLFIISCAGTKDTTPPANPSINFGGTAETASQTITAALSASDDTGITGYYLSEVTTTPGSSSSNWVSVPSIMSYSSTVSFTLSSGAGTKTVYVWFKDAAGNVSAAASNSITLKVSDNTAPSNPSVSINNGAASTTSNSVTLTLSAIDNNGVTGYYASENPNTPLTSADGWVSLTSSASYSAAVPFTLSSGNIGDNAKTVYVWFKDAAGNVSAAASNSITLKVSDNTAPSNPSVSINNGAASTTSNSVTLTLSAIDNVAITGYCAKESSAVPLLNDACWVNVASTTSYSANISSTLSSDNIGDNTKAIYVWFKDGADNISTFATDNIIFSSWKVFTIDNTWYAGYTSIAVDSKNKVHISYYNNTNNASDLKYATNASDSWVTSTLDSTGNTGLYTSIAADSNNKIHISYRDYTKGDLKYATNASGSWVTSTLDSTGDAGWFTSIAVDSNNSAHISYYDNISSNLKYAANASGSWVITTADSMRYAGGYTSIAVDSNNKAYISYYDYITSDLKYAANASGSWVTSTLDNTGNAGLYTSIAVDSKNKVHISYRDNTNSDLKYAANASGSWVITTLDNTGNAGLYTSIAVDSKNKVHISYRDNANSDLKYATNASGSWVTFTLDNTGNAGLYTSIAIDSNNRVHISYYGARYGLKYVTNQ